MSFESENEKYGRYFWYGIVACVGTVGFVNWQWMCALKSRRNSATYDGSSPARRPGLFATAQASAYGVFRGISYPQFTPIRYSFWMIVPSMGTIILLVGYLGFLLALEYIDSNFAAGLKSVSLSIRASWLAMAQMPLLILLVGKHNPVGYITGVSYERLNILHRWVARGTLLMATLHFAYMTAGWNDTEYGRENPQWSSGQSSPSGMGAWAVLLWLNLSTLAPFRNFSYEFFLIQHILTFFGFLIAVAIHLPDEAHYARVYIYIPVGIWAADRLIRTTRLVWHNRSASQAELTAMSCGVTKIRISNKKIARWTPGSHVFICIPKFGVGQSHPATILSTPNSHGGDLVFLLKSHRGFTGRINSSAAPSPKPSATNSIANSALDLPCLEKAAPISSVATPKTYKCFIDGPYAPSTADFLSFSTVLLVAGSTGITFILPILLDLAHRASVANDNRKYRIATRRVQLLWMVRSSSCIDWIGDELKIAVEILRANGVEVGVRVHVTRDETVTEATARAVLPSGPECKCDRTVGPCHCSATTTTETTPLESEATTPIHEVDEPGAYSNPLQSVPTGRTCTTWSSARSSQPSPREEDHAEIATVTNPEKTEATPTNIQPTISAYPASHFFSLQHGRPSILQVLGALVASADGEVGVAVCGPLGLNAMVRRAVAGFNLASVTGKVKGGVYLHAEGFGS